MLYGSIKEDVLPIVEIGDYFVIEPTKKAASFVLLPFI